MPSIEGQHVRIVLGDEVLADADAPPGLLGLRVPLPASDRERRVELHWEKTTVLSSADPREVSARVEYFGLVPLRGPAAVELPNGLRIPGLDFAGFHADGWVDREAHIVVSARDAVELAICGEVPSELGEQVLEVLLDGEVAWTERVGAGPLDVRAPVRRPSDDVRVDLRWSATTSPGARDPRAVAARITFVGAAAGTPPVALRPSGRELSNPSLRNRGIHLDGSLERSVSLRLTQRGETDLVLRCEIAEPPPDELVLAVDGDVLHRGPAEVGGLHVRARVPATAGPTVRTVELAFAGSGRPPLLRFVGFVQPTRPTVATVETLDDPRLDHGGIDSDGWLGKEAWLVLGHGPAATLTAILDAVPSHSQTLAVRVDGVPVAEAFTSAGRLEARGVVAASDRPRRVELQLSGETVLSKSDRRRVAARLVRVALQS